MSQMKSIDIDFHIYKKLEQERRNFSETYNEILHRLLEINTTIPETINVSGNGDKAAWHGDGVILPHGTVCRLTYNKSLHTASIKNGKWITDDKGEVHTSPSGAAESVARTKAGKKTKLDGWRYWEVKRPGDKEWKKLERLRSGKILDELLG